MACCGSHSSVCVWGEGARLCSSFQDICRWQQLHVPAVGETLPGTEGQNKHESLGREQGGVGQALEVRTVGCWISIEKWGWKPRAQDLGHNTRESMLWQLRDLESPSTGRATADYVKNNLEILEYRQEYEGNRVKWKRNSWKTDEMFSTLTEKGRHEVPQDCRIRLIRRRLTDL